MDYSSMPSPVGQQSTSSMDQFALANTASLSALQDLLAGASPRQAEFSDLLAEFTMPHTSAFSPEQLNIGRSPESNMQYVDYAAGSSRDSAGGSAGNSNPRKREKSVQETLLEQFGIQAHQSAVSNAPSPAGSASSPAASAHGGKPKDNVTNAIANMDPSTRSQLLNALLTLKHQQQSNGASPGASIASPRNVPIIQSPRQAHKSSNVYDGGQHHHQHQQAHQRQQASVQHHSSAHPSPLANFSQHNSPQPFSNYSSPMPTYPQQSQAPPPQMLQQQAFQQQLEAAQMNGSLPPSLVSSPAGSPYLRATAPNQYPVMTGAAPIPQSVPPFTALPNMAMYGQQQNFTQTPQQQQQLQQQVQAMQTQLAMDMLSRGNAQQVGGDMNLRGQATGESYASTAAGREDWSGENDFIFSPLMSPALTPQSVFTAASSVPTSSSYMPSGSLVSPADFFSPLGSPAIMPQFQDEAHAAAYQQALHHSASLQGLVDQTRAMGFDSSSLAAFTAQAAAQAQAQGQGQGTFGSPVIAPQAGASPRLGPTGDNTATGSGRRGASSSKKVRPSPLLKPTPDGQLRRKKAASVNDRRSSSISSATGHRSGTSSPFLGPTVANGNGKGSANVSPNPNGTGSQKTSPSDEGQQNEINTPSPVDLAMHDVASAKEQRGHTQQQGSSTSHQHELMGPPPLPPSASGSRRQSLQNGVESLNPVTPASFMNLPADFDMTTLSALSPALHAQRQADQSTPDPATNGEREQKRAAPSPTASSSGTATPNGSAPSSTSRPKQPRLLPRLPSTSDVRVDTSPSSTPAPTPAASGPAANSKGKGKAAAAPAATTKKGASKVKASPKIGPASKVKPLLPGGVAPDDIARLSSKSNYQNIVEGCGDIIGLDPSTVAAVQANGGAEVRRHSHKAAEQKRRDSLKARFEELRVLLPPIAMSANPEDRRPGEGNVGGQRTGNLDPDNPNKGVSKVALLGRSNEYIGMLLDRVERRDMAIKHMREKVRKMRSELGLPDEDVDEEVPGLDLDNIDRDEREAGTMAFYENLSDDEDLKRKPARRPSVAKRRSSGAASATADSDSKARSVGARRSTRRSSGAAATRVAAISAADDSMNEEANETADTDAVDMMEE